MSFLGLTLDDAQKITAVISGFGALVSLSAAIVAVRFAKQNLARELLNQRLNVVTTRLKYFEEFRKWADQIALVLTEAIHLCDLDPSQVEGESFFDRRHRLRIALSTMIDRGRWFFPNLEVDDHGADKELVDRIRRFEPFDCRASD
jgi:hypothetical protein